MKAAAWNTNGSLDVFDTERPEPDLGWARLAVAACGICGSDLHGFRQGRGGRPGHQPGHEVAGYLDGPVAGTDLEEGRLYALEPIDSCNDCSFCGTGHYNLCRSRRLIGGGAPGGLAEKILVPAHRLYLHQWLQVCDSIFSLRWSQTDRGYFRNTLLNHQR